MSGFELCGNYLFRIADVLVVEKVEERDFYTNRQQVGYFVYLRDKAQPLPLSEEDGSRLWDILVI